MVHVRRSWSSLLLLAVALSACESSSDGALDVTSSPVSDAAVAGDLPPAGADVSGEVADVPPPSDLGSSDVVVSDMSVAPETSPADSGPGPDVGEPGPIVSGYTDVNVDNPDGDTMSLSFWYPARGPFPGREPELYLGLVTGEAWRDVTALDGRFPVLLFSHGSSAWPVQSATLCEAWARAGWVVVAPEHVGNTILDGTDPEKLAKVAIRRPKDLVAALEAATVLAGDPDHLLFQKLDLTRVSVAGHSFGAYTSLIAAGAQVDIPGAKAACAAGNDLFGLCSAFDPYPDELLDLRPPELIGLDAAIAMSPAFWVIFREVGLASIDVPTFIMVGDSDTLTPADEDGLPIFEEIGGVPKALAYFADAGHYAFSNFCDIPNIEKLSAGRIAECNDDYVDWRLAMEVTAELSLAWLEMHALADPSQAVRLEQATVDGRWPGVVEVTHTPLAQE